MLVHRPCRQTRTTMPPGSFREPNPDRLPSETPPTCLYPETSGSLWGLRQPPRPAAECRRFHSFHWELHPSYRAAKPGDHLPSSRSLPAWSDRPCTDRRCSESTSPRRGSLQSEPETCAEEPTGNQSRSTQYPIGITILRSLAVASCSQTARHHHVRPVPLATPFLSSADKHRAADHGRRPLNTRCRF